jgi:lipoate-protein ligase A
VINKVKIVGSAQRRRPGAVLQHGSFLLRKSPHTPELPGLAEFVASTESAPVWAERLQKCVPDALGLVAEPDDFTETERERARVIEKQVYRNPEWTGRR